MTTPVIRRAVPADAAAVRGVIERALRVSAAGVYPASAVEAWAAGGTVEAARRMIDDTEGCVATVGRAIVGWANLDGNEVDQLYVDPVAEAKVSPVACTRPSNSWLAATGSWR